MKKNLLSIIAIVLSLFAICFVLLRAIFCEVSNDTSIGAMATLIGIFVTLHIGYQIYNALELKKEIAKQTRLFRAEIAKQKKKSEELDKLIAEQKKAIESQKNEMNLNIDMIAAFLAHSQKCGISAFGLMHAVIKSSLQIRFTKYKDIFDFLKIFISEINFDDENIINIIDAEEKEIRQHENFCRIELEYNKVMQLFRKRISEIKDNPEKKLTQVEKDAIKNS